MPDICQCSTFLLATIVHELIIRERYPMSNTQEPMSITRTYILAEELTFTRTTKRHPFKLTSAINNEKELINSKELRLHPDAWETTEFMVVTRSGNLAPFNPSGNEITFSSLTSSSKFLAGYDTDTNKVYLYIKNPSSFVKNGLGN